MPERLAAEADGTDRATVRAVAKRKGMSLFMDLNIEVLNVVSFCAPRMPHEYCRRLAAGLHFGNVRDELRAESLPAATRRFSLGPLRIRPTLPNCNVRAIRP